MINSNHFIESFIWQFGLDIQGVPFWSDFRDQVLESKGSDNCEQRFFWGAQDLILLNGLSEAQLWLSSYQFETHQDAYVLLNDNQNIKFRNKKLHVKPLLTLNNGTSTYRDKQKYHLLKQQKEIAALLGNNDFASLKTKSEVKGLLRKTYPVCDVYKEALTLDLMLIANISIEFSKLKINEQIFYSLVVESKFSQLVEKAVSALGIKKTPETYVQFLKRIVEC